MPATAAGQLPSRLPCASCSAYPALARSAYCGRLCRDTAALIRAYRRYESAGWQCADGQDAARMAIACQMKFVAAGVSYIGWRRQHGLPDRLPDEVRAAVIERDGGMCQARNCYSPGTQVDHVEWTAVTTDDISGLQLLCHRCHLKKSTGYTGPEDDFEEGLRLACCGEMPGSPVHHHQCLSRCRRCGYLKAAAGHQVSCMPSGSLAVRNGNPGKAAGITGDEPVPLTFTQVFDRLYRRLSPAVRKRIESPQPLLACDQPDWGSKWREYAQKAGI